MKKYSVVLADPPWPYAQRAPHSDENPTKFGGGATSQYPLMSFKEINALPVMTLAEKNCAVCVWATMPHLKQGIEALEAWGLRYATVLLCWEKTNADGTPWYGPGGYTGSNIELLLLGVHGSMPPTQKGVYQVMRAPHPREWRADKNGRMGWRIIHSRKPEETYNRIETLYGNHFANGHVAYPNKAELFARVPRPGWDSFGLDIDGRLLQDSLGDLAREEYDAKVAEWQAKRERNKKAKLLLPKYLECFRTPEPETVPGQLSLFAS